MKTKELIRQLQEADPSGEDEVSVGNVDIHFVDREPAYYDGCLQVLVRDEAQNGYNITGAKLVSQGNKVVIHTLSITDALWDNAELPIDYSGLTEGQAERYKETHEKVRQEVRDCEKELEQGHNATNLLSK